MKADKTDKGILTTYLALNYISNTHLNRASLDGMEMEQAGNRYLLEVQVGEGSTIFNQRVFINYGEAESVRNFV